MDIKLLHELFAAVKEESRCGGELTLCTQSAQQEDLNKLTEKWGASMLATKKIRDRLGL